MALAGGSGCLGDRDPRRTNLLIHSASLTVLRVGRSGCTSVRTFAGGRGGPGRTVAGVTVPVAGSRRATLPGPVTQLRTGPTGCSHESIISAVATYRLQVNFKLNAMPRQHQSDSSLTARPGPIRRVTGKVPGPVTVTPRRRVTELAAFPATGCQLESP